MEGVLSQRKRSRVDSAESATEFDPTKAKRIRDDLLSLLDDPDTVPPSHDLDSVIRSFEEEISGSGSPSPDPDELSGLTSASGEVLPEFGFAGEGVGLPVETSQLVRVTTESGGIGELWDFQDELPSYDDPFGFGSSFVGGEVENEYVALDGIFDYSDVNFGSDFSWRPETLPAL